MSPVQPSVHVQLKPVGSSTQVAPFIHGDDKQACSTDERKKTEEVEKMEAWQRRKEGEMRK